jgi:hypothetical protein
MRNTFSKLLLLIMLGSGIFPSFAQDKDLSNSSYSRDSPIDNIKTISGKQIPVNQLDEFIRRAMDSVGMPGLSIAIINDAEIVYHRSFGVTNVETKEPVTAQGHGHEKGKITDAMQHGKSFGAGYSLHTEAVDYAGFLVEMIKSEHLNKELRDEMLKAQNEFPPDHELVATGQTGWGLGFARRATLYGMRYMHTGNNHDFQSYCCFYKEKKYGLVCFTNSDKIEPFYDRLGKFLEDEF